MKINRDDHITKVDINKKVKKLIAELDYYNIVGWDFNVKT